MGEIKEQDLRDRIMGVIDVYDFSLDMLESLTTGIRTCNGACRSQSSLIYL